MQPKDVQAELQKVVGPNIEVTADPGYIGETTPASPLRPDVLDGGDQGGGSASTDRKCTSIATMSTGASDGCFFRAKGIPVYDIDGSWGISPMDDRAHGLDERIPVRAMYDDVLHWESTSATSRADAQAGSAILRRL